MMKSFFQKHISMSVVLMMLICGICLSASRPGSPLARVTTLMSDEVTSVISWNPSQTSDIIHSLSTSYSEGFLREVYHQREWGSRLARSNYQYHVMQLVISDLLTAKAERHYRVSRQDESLYQLFSQNIIDYLHHSDGV